LSHQTRLKRLVSDLHAEMFSDFLDYRHHNFSILINLYSKIVIKESSKNLYIYMYIHRRTKFKN